MKDHAFQIHAQQTRRRSFVDRWPLASSIAISIGISVPVVVWTNMPPFMALLFGLTVGFLVTTYVLTRR